MYPFLFLSAAALGISVFSFFFFKSYLKRRTGQERILLEFREEVNKILRAIDETTERDISLIEERERNLKSILEETDKRLKLFIREMEIGRDAENAYASLRQKNVINSSGRGGPSYEELGKSRYRLLKSDDTNEFPGERETNENAEPDKAASEVMETSSAVPGAPGSSFPLPDFIVKGDDAAKAQGTEPLPSMSEQIRAFLHAGLAPNIIASRLGISIAEVEFFAALLERRES